MKDLITVIVPVYNVEDYLPKCINSILKQTYNNIEIILVDDGSTDSSGAICDSYSRKNNNITVIHKSNGGLSSARNSGMKMMHGKYVMFLDSDDWIESETIKLLYDLMVQNEAQMTAVKFNPIYPDTKYRVPTINDEYIVFDKKSALESFLFNGYLSPCACGKLWRTKDWLGIEFPEGKLFEDQYTIYKVIEKLDKAVLSNNRFYNYLKRENSIGHSKFSKRTYDLYDAINIEYEYLSSNYPEIKDTLMVAKITWEIVFVNMMLLSTDMNNALISSVRSEARKNYNKCIKCSYIPHKRKLQIALFGFCLPLYKVMYKNYKKKHKYT